MKLNKSIKERKMIKRELHTIYYYLRREGRGGEGERKEQRGEHNKGTKGRADLAMAKREHILMIINNIYNKHTKDT